MVTKILCTVGTSTLDKIKMDRLPWESRNFKENPVEFSDHENLAENCKMLTNERMYAKTANSYNEDIVYDFSHDISIVSKKFIKEAKRKQWKEWEPNTWRIMPAEVGSTLRIIEKHNLTPDNCEIILMVSDTGESYVASQIIEKIFNDLEFSTTSYIINGFQMEDMQWFSDEGLPNFIEKISEGIKDDQTIFNITGGYKNFIPIVTHIASFYRKDMYYVFEEAIGHGTNALVKIPKIPTFNTVLADKNSIILEFIESIRWHKFESIDSADDYISESLSSIFEGLGPALASYTEFVKDFYQEADGKVSLTLIGKIYLKLLLIHREVV